MKKMPLGLTGLALCTAFTLPPIAPDDDCKCNLPRPSGLQLVSTGTTNITVKWSPVSGAAYYRLKAYDQTTKKLASSTLVPAKPSNNSAILANLNPLSNFTITAASVCANGMESVNN